MSVEKFSPYGDGKIRHERKPYTLVLNKVSNESDNLQAIGLWLHFQCKPEDWVISVQYVQNRFKIGRDKAYNILRYLIKTNLMQQVQEKNPDGTFAGNYYVIKNGEEFTPPPEKLSTPLPENPDPDFPDPENPTTTNTSNTTNTSKEKKGLLAHKKHKEIKAYEPPGMVRIQSHPKSSALTNFAGVETQSTSNRPSNIQRGSKEVARMHVRAISKKLGRSAYE
jgi:hypothetical protein